MLRNHLSMPIFMDLHIAPGISAKDAAEAHREDLKIQDEYGCRCMTYWVDEDRGSAFCLIDAPNKQAVREMHDRAHGLIPHEIIQVNSNVVEAFLGRIQDPDTFAQLGDEKLKVFNDPAFRVIMVADTQDRRLLEHDLGVEKSRQLYSLFTSLMNEKVSCFEGRIVELRGDDLVISFVSVSQAVECALALQNHLHIAGELIQLRLGIHAGMPISKNDTIFGDTIQMARNQCFVGRKNQIVLSPIIQELYKNDWRKLKEKHRVKTISPQDEIFLESVLGTIANHWNNPLFGVSDLAEKTGMSTSRLYRKCTELFHLSPNHLIKEYRLRQSLTLLRSERSISQTTYDSGFTSPSYFTKCFQQRFGLLPLSYVRSLG